jgi:hypothetical protein
MKLIITLICCIVLPILSLKQIKPKLCVDCKYFLTDNKDGKFGKCSLFPTKEGQVNYLVTGIKEEYYFCSTARESTNMCDLEGKMYKKKYVKKVNLLN